jgi:hypothetical protein
VEYWEDFSNDPVAFALRPAVTNSSAGFFFKVFSELATKEREYSFPFRGVSPPSVFLRDLKLEPEAEITPQSTLGRHYQSPKAFRLAHPSMVFFRCWNCDLFAQEDTGPLLPPEKYAHSTVRDDLLPGRRPDYNLRDEILGSRPQKPEYISPNVNQLDGRFRSFYGGANGTAKPDQAILQWAQQETARAHQMDEQLNQRREADYYREVQEWQRRVDQYPERPDARTHSPCPNCGTSFPLLLRPTGDDRYSQRNADNYNRPLTVVEHFLQGSNMTTSVWLKTTRKDLSQSILDYYFEICGLSCNPLFVLSFEERVKERLAQEKVDKSWMWSIPTKLGDRLLIKGSRRPS